MMNSTNRITWRNGFLLNGKCAPWTDIQSVLDSRRSELTSIWEQYEQSKAALRQLNLSPEQYQDACRQIADALGI